MLQIVPIVLIISGVFALAILVIRHLPDIVQTPQDGSGAGAARTSSGPFAFLGSMISRERRIAYQRTILGILERVLRKTSLRLLTLTRFTEKMLHGVQRRSLKFSEGSGVSFPKFVNRFKKRRAYVEEERKLLEHVLRSPGDVDAYRRLGNLYLLLGNIHDARAALNQALKLNPDDEETKAKLAKIEEQLETSA